MAGLLRVVLSYREVEFFKITRVEMQATKNKMPANVMLPLV